MLQGGDQQALQLKRLLVTMKQKYEEHLQSIQGELQEARSQRESLQRELERVSLELKDTNTYHEDELAALYRQQQSLQELLTAGKQELEQHHQSQEETTQKIQFLQTELVLEQRKNQQKVESLQQSLDLFRNNNDQNPLQEKYEQLKEEALTLSQQLEEALEARIAAEKKMTALQEQFQSQQDELHQSETRLGTLLTEHDHLQREGAEWHLLFEESESRLKAAQQHLAKKVKEVTLLNEKNEELHAHLTGLQQSLETSNAQIHHLQTHVDLYQKQEKRLQDQLHDALKGTESQVSKWEQKYFHMYDKWQESEARIRELKKYEEKHAQMQALLANLGSVMGPSITSGNVTQEPPKTVEIEDERYDLFGMRPPPSHFN